MNEETLVDKMDRKVATRLLILWWGSMISLNIFAAMFVDVNYSVISPLGNQVPPIAIEQIFYFFGMCLSLFVFSVFHRPVLDSLAEGGPESYFWGVGAVMLSGLLAPFVMWYVTT